MHVEVFTFCAHVAAAFPSYFSGVRILEVGSRDVNGSVRPLFRGCDYVGLDCCPGPGVDVVGLAHEYRPDKPFDTIITCEALEHDPHLPRTLAAAASLLRPGGLFLATCAGPERPEHGTRRTEDAGGTWGPDDDFYRNVPAELLRDLCGSWLRPLEVFYDRGGQDLRAVGFRA